MAAGTPPFSAHSGWDPEPKVWGRLSLRQTQQRVPAPSIASLLLRSRAGAGRHHPQHPQGHKLHFFHLIKQKLPVASLFLLKLIKAFLIRKLRNSRTQLLLSSISDSNISLGPHVIRVSSGTILTSNEKDIYKGIRSKHRHDRYFD